MAFGSRRFFEILVAAAALLLASTAGCRTEEKAPQEEPVEAATAVEPAETEPVVDSTEAEPETEPSEQDEGAAEQQDEGEEAATESPASQESEGGVIAAAEADGCEQNTVRCGDACVDILASEEHCGKCGTRCFHRQDCDEGVCRGLGVVSVSDLQRRLEDKDFLLINVRYPPVGLIPGTDASIPHDRMEAIKAAIGDDLDRRLVLYCGTTGRVQMPLRALLESGYRSVAYVDGGVTAWRMAGLPLEN